MERFDKSGHLTDEALSALISREMGELSRLEAAEHLSYCDRCLDRYLALMTGEVLEMPAHSCRENLLQRIRRQALKLFENRIATVAAAVIIVVSLWSGGGISALCQLPAKLTQLPNTVSQSIEEQNQEDKPSFFDSIGDWFSGHGYDQTNNGGQSK